jgi:hypothetical protein
MTITPVHENREQTPSCMHVTTLRAAALDIKGSFRNVATAQHAAFQR